MQPEAPLTLILSPLRAGRGELERTYLGFLFGDPDTVPPKVPLSLRKRERVRVRVRLDCMDTAKATAGRLRILCCSLFQRFDRFRLLRGAQAVPRLYQFLLVLGGPFQDHGADAAWRIALDDPQRNDADDQFTVLVNGMKVRRERTDEQHPYHDPVEF